jgi:hypothetical protein
VKLLDYITYRRRGMRPGLSYALAYERHGLTLGDVILVAAMVAPVSYGYAHDVIATDTLARSTLALEHATARRQAWKLEAAFIQCLNRGTVEVDRWTHTCEIKRIPL